MANKSQERKLQSVSQAPLVKQAPFQLTPRLFKDKVPKNLPFDATKAMIAMTLQNTTFKKTKVVHKGKLMSLKNQLLEGYNNVVANVSG